MELHKIEKLKCLSNKQTCNNVELWVTVILLDWILWVHNAAINSWELQPISRAEVVTAAKVIRLN